MATPLLFARYTLLKDSNNGSVLAASKAISQQPFTCVFFIDAFPLSLSHSISSWVIRVTQLLVLRFCLYQLDMHHVAAAYLGFWARLKVFLSRIAAATAKIANQ